MGSKIEAAAGAVAPGSLCSACVVASGADLNVIRAILGPKSDYGTKGTLFCTPGSALLHQALADVSENEVRVMCRKQLYDFALDN
jgi:hypothetical protein